MDKIVISRLAHATDFTQLALQLLQEPTERVDIEFLSRVESLLDMAKRDVTLSIEAMYKTVQEDSSDSFFKKELEQVAEEKAIANAAKNTQKVVGSIKCSKCGYYLENCQCDLR